MAAIEKPRKYARTAAPGISIAGGVTRFAQDAGVSILCHRSMALWSGYPDAALADAKQALQEARDIGQATNLPFALFFTSLTQIFCGNYATATKEHDELIALADEKGSLTWKALCTPMQGCLFALTGKASDAVQGSPPALPHCGQLEQHCGCRCTRHILRERMRSLANSMTLGAALAKAEVHRVAGEIALKSPEPDAAKAQAHFERALEVSRQQQAKSWELRAAMSMARLWRDQGQPQQARELLAPVYGWFTEGFDTLDLKEAKALLDELRA